MSRKPVICVAGEHDYAIQAMSYNPVYAINKAFTQAIARAGGVPFTPLGVNLEERYCDLADGLLLTGNQHIHPGRYGSTFLNDELAKGVNPWRDYSDFDLLAAFMYAGKPILGIGRGMQVINVALGGNLFQSLEYERKIHNVASYHPVEASAGSFLEQLFGGHFRVNSFHRQGVNVVGNGLEVVAQTPDGIIEAIAHQSSPIYGVQFRPELLDDTVTQREVPDMGLLFSFFLGKCLAAH
ncbi:MAG: gamma-glutamyl-gamma-aminobutyrate hydrolase family protein [Symbiobacteriaceae bacterium]|nr:gamma-glutamyl-gamma-aminobutyrate hydrolase family protein [Symbiobacteriaceae bacterium]